MLQEILAIHEPNAYQSEHVYSVWEDGEITIEKGGELYGARHLHTLVPGAQANLMAVESMPLKNVTRSHGFLTTTSFDVAKRARTLMIQFGALTQRHFTNGLCSHSCPFLTAAFECEMFESGLKRSGDTAERCAACLAL